MFLPVTVLREYNGSRLWTMLARAVGITCKCCPRDSCGCRCRCFDTEADDSIDLDQKLDVLSIIELVPSLVQLIYEWSDSQSGYIALYKSLKQLL